MTTGYSTLTKRQARRDIKGMREETLKIISTRKKAVAFLIKAGILAKGGKRLARRYR
jgi:hypothetical protein